MLRLLFNAGGEKYVVESIHVIEIVPHVLLSPLKNCPEAIKGVLNYRGELVPVLDFCMLLTGEPACEFLSTRIVILEDKDQTPQKIGIIAEKVTEAIDTPEDVSGLSVNFSKSPYVDKVITQSGITVNHLNLNALFRYSLHFNKFVSEG